MSIGQNPIASVPIAWSDPTPAGPARYFFDPWATVLSQYANSPILLQLIDDFAQWLDPQSRFDAFFDLMWNIDSAQGYGLDVWGRILGVSRVLQISRGAYLGFEQDAQAQTFDHGIFFGGGRVTDNASLTDNAYRTLLLAKAALNITDASIPSINAILLNLFGNGYVIDNLDMTMTYHFTRALTKVEIAIIGNSGVLPKPCGVGYNYEAIASLLTELGAPITTESGSILVAEA